MPSAPVTLHWPHGRSTVGQPGEGWLTAARTAGFSIPTGCLGGSCGACEIEVNGRIVRACIARVPPSRSGELTVELAVDPFWG
ncbi:MAG: 2Fe-2S iron-sulfur cluster-binding protein [Cyanobacteriota bacterium]|nr:2Fe-2S iron-sulfur cluster-binding protein [Cyanobacteriota bacterium]